MSARRGDLPLHEACPTCGHGDPLAEIVRELERERFAPRYRHAVICARCRVEIDDGQVDDIKE